MEVSEEFKECILVLHVSNIHGHVDIIIKDGKLNTILIAIKFKEGPLTTSNQPLSPYTVALRLR
jgi:hypothetical protein